MSDDSEADPPTRGKPAPLHLKSVGDAPPLTLAPAHVEDLRSSGLSDETIELAGIYSESKSAPIAAILKWGWRNGGGMVIPFRDYDSGKLLLARVKPDRPRMRTKGTRKRPIKYEQAPGTGAVPFLPPRTLTERRLEDATRSIVWVEGEKKALLLDELGYAAIGITGSHNWNDAEKYRNGDGLTWSKPLRKYAERFVKGRRHVIAFDSDAFANDNVLLAMRRLAGLLLDGGAASVHVVRVPPDPNDDERGRGIDDYYVEEGAEAAARCLAALELVAPGEEVTPIPPRDPLLKLAALAWLRGAKLDQDLRLPPRFEIRRDRSLWVEPPADKPEADQREIMRGAIIPTRLFRELDGEEERLELAYFAAGQWRTAVVDRKACRDARRALAELPPAASIDSNNAALVVLWLGEYLRHNEARLVTRRFVGVGGWHLTEDERCFMLGEPVSSEPSSRLVADDSGDRSDVLRALTPRGDYDAHLAALRAAFDEDPIAAMAILGALAAPLLGPLDAPNFAIHFPGESSRGKTSIVKIGGSVYGNPSSEQWIGSWNATATAMELRAATLTDLPLCFDEVGAGDVRVIERSIYMLINGAGKSRGDRALRVRRTPTWRTVVLSTGEHELADETANTGAQVRVLQFRVSGFGSLDGAGVDALREACERNYGHVGRRWIESLVAIEDWTPYRELFDKAKAQFRARESSSLMARQAVYYALLAVAEHFAHATLGIGKANGETVRSLFVDTKQRREIESVGERARGVVSEWIASEPQTFPFLGFNTSGGLVAEVHASVRRIAGVRYKDAVYLLPNELRERLTRHGISYAEVIAGWADAGYLDCDAGKKTKRARWDGRRIAVYSVKCDALGLEASEPQATQTSSDFDD